MPEGAARAGAASRPRAHLDGARLLADLDALGALGAGRDLGVTRLAFSAAFRAGRDLVATCMAGAGLTCWLDAAGNLFGALEGQAVRERGGAVLLVGSHLDTVEQAGLLDGAYGVLGALAAYRALARVDPELARHVVLVGFCNEEGAFGTAGMTGSRAIASGLSRAELAGRATDGRSLAELLALVGDGGTLEGARWAPGSLAAYLELHIEQGPVLEGAGAGIGIVTAITGRTSLDVEFAGRADHAGTTPMATRRDALAAAAQFVLAVEDLARRGVVRVATTGGLALEPNVRNTVPGRVRLLVEVRDARAAAMAEAVRELRAAGATIAGQRDLSCVLHEVEVVAPTPTDADLRAELEGAAHRVGARTLELASGAGHDAQAVAAIAPVGMLFVPSVGGTSHAPGEATHPDDLVAGAAVLAEAILGLGEHLGLVASTGPAR